MGYLMEYLKFKEGSIDNTIVLKKLKKSLLGEAQNPSRHKMAF